MSTTTPNMASITASLKECSLNNRQRGDAGEASADGTVELNSEVSLPFHWEQCLDLKSGEIYYINWRTGMRATEDPRTAEEYYSDEEEDGSSSYGDSEDSLSGNSSSSILVVAGCKRCWMYYMVPKQLQICPKCCCQLLHMDQSQNAPSSSSSSSSSSS